MKSLLIAAMLAGSALAAPALAQSAAPDAAAPDDGGMRHMDRGPITRDAYLARADKRFARMDANNDGAVTINEIGMRRPMNGNSDTPPPAPAGENRFAQHMLDRLDTNHDGKVTRDEMRADAAARFDAADTNHDGTLDESEQEAMRGMMRQRMDTMRERHEARRGGDGAPPPPGDQPQPNADQ
jgi:hypothetical protein